MLDFLKQEEKKVEYIELIYDLIFVYMIGRNSSLISHIENGFIAPDLYLTYCVCTLITIQIWFFSTMFINRYGSNRPSEYVGLFINMFLLYYMAEGTRIQWQSYFYRYNVAWLLILLNIAVQYYLKYRQVQKEKPWEAVTVTLYIRILLIQAAIILAGILLYRPTGLPLTPAAMVFGILAVALGRKGTDLTAVDFSHLTERIMLYIVFTFGEMVIAISSYFESGISPINFYYALMTFLIVVGLFMSYGFYYDKLLDREMNISGNAYMLIHVFMIFALSNLTIAMEFMREPGISVFPKNVFLVASFVFYYLFLFLAAPYTRTFRGNRKYLVIPILVLIVFAALLLLSYKHALIGIALSVLLTFTVWFLMWLYWKTCLCKDG